MIKEKCVNCKINMRKKKIRIDLPRGSVKIEGYECPKCKEQNFTHKQALKGEDISISKNLWGSSLWLERKVTTVGNSPAVVIPRDIAKQLHIKKGTEIKIGLIGEEIVIREEK